MQGGVLNVRSCCQRSINACDYGHRKSGSSLVRYARLHVASMADAALHEDNLVPLFPSTCQNSRGQRVHSSHLISKHVLFVCVCARATPLITKGQVLQVTTYRLLTGCPTTEESASNKEALQDLQDIMMQTGTPGAATLQLNQDP